MPIPDRPVIGFSSLEDEPKIGLTFDVGLELKPAVEHPLLQVDLALSNAAEFALYLCLYHENGSDQQLLPFDRLLPSDVLFKLCSFDLRRFGNNQDGPLSILDDALNAALNRFGQLRFRRTSGGRQPLEVRLEIGLHYAFVDFRHPSAAGFKLDQYFIRS